MEEHPLDQGSWGRARDNTIRAFHTFGFWLTEAIVVLLMSGITLVLRVPPIVQAIAVFLGPLLALLFLFAGYLVSTPYLQRDEARAALMNRAASLSRDEIDDVISSLRAQTVQGVSLAQVFADIAPYTAYERDQGEIASQIVKLLNIKLDPAQPGKERLEYRILGTLVAAGVLELKHPGKHLAGHPYIRSVYMTEFGRAVLHRLAARPG